MLFMTFSAFYDLWERVFFAVTTLFQNKHQIQILSTVHTQMNSTDVWVHQSRLTLCLITWKNSFRLFSLLLMCTPHRRVTFLSAFGSLCGVIVEQLFSNITCQHHPGYTPIHHLIVVGFSSSPYTICFWLVILSKML
jgi:hypothetical protein